MIRGLWKPWCDKGDHVGLDLDGTEFFPLFEKAKTFPKSILSLFELT